MNGLFLSIGAGPGMGITTATRFAREGFDLVLAARDTSKLEQLAERIRQETSRSVKTAPLDATNFNAVQEMSERFGERVSVFHYNAAAVQALSRTVRPNCAGATNMAACSSSTRRGSWPAPRRPMSNARPDRENTAHFADMVNDDRTLTRFLPVGLL